MICFSHHHEQHLAFYRIKQTDSMLPWVCAVPFVLDRERPGNVVRASVMHSLALPCVQLFSLLSLPHFDIICDLLLNRHMAT